MLQQQVINHYYCHYHWAYLANPDDYPGQESCWIGQSNGICGTALPGHISFMFGPHTGSINMRVFCLQSTIPVADEWEEVVESPFLILHKKVLYFTDFNGETYGEPMVFEPGEYRVRFCAKKYGASEVADPRCDVPNWTNEERRAVVADECYELTFWKEALRPDEIIKVTSPNARSWHKFRQEDEAKRKI
jgi:hypothetical protein